ncbi:MAG: hypothetical protein IJT58_06500 [Synergistaceae bacterium]|nr:hypothetical protein [Synergistaceae bacterium]
MEVHGRGSRLNVTMNFDGYKVSGSGVIQGSRAVINFNDDGEFFKATLTFGKLQRGLVEIISVRCHDEDVDFFDGNYSAYHGHM